MPHRTERFVLWLLTVGLIFLVAIQMMMTNEEARDYLLMVEGQVKSLFPPVAQPVAMIEEGDEHITIKVLNRNSYSKARVMLNNEQAFYFEQGSLQIPVNHGDFLILDTRGVPEAMWFEITAVSDGITSVEVGQQYRVLDGLAVLPVETARAGKL